RLEEGSVEEYQVRRVAGVNHLEAPRREDAAGQHELTQDRGTVFEGVGQRTPRLKRQRMTIDRDAIDDLPPPLVALADRANDGALVARCGQRRRFLPNPSVEGDWQVLHDDQDAEPAHLTS